MSWWKPSRKAIRPLRCRRCFSRHTYTTAPRSSRRSVSVVLSTSESAGRGAATSKDAPLNPHPDATGTQVSGIVHAGHVLYVWSYGPPFGGWANPSMVGPSSVTNIEYFDGH